jgi:hypothetical protein
MQRLPSILAGAVLLAGLLSWPAFPEGGAPQRSAAPTEEEKQVKAILAAKDPSDAETGYHALFKSATTSGLRRLQTNPSDTIAIQAAWQEVELTVPERPERVVRPDRDKLSWFLGFLEGRGRVQAPQWWAEAVLDARANRRGNVYAGGVGKADPRMARPNAAAPPHQATLGHKDGKPVVWVGSVSAPIPRDLDEKLKTGASIYKVSALITSSHCYVAVYGPVGCPYRLTCVERSSAKTRWVAEVWASWWYPFSGYHRGWVEVTEQGNRVVVFGVASVGFHAEAFRMEDGANVFRFSNSYAR